MTPTQERIEANPFRFRLPMNNVSRARSGLSARPAAAALASAPEIAGMLLAAGIAVRERARKAASSRKTAAT
jgi:hypothetical protein